MANKTITQLTPYVSPQPLDVLPIVQVETGITKKVTLLDLGVGAIPGGSDTSIQFNDGQVFNGDDNLTWDKNDKTLAIESADDSSSQVIPFRIFSPAGNVFEVGFSEGDIFMGIPDDGIPKNLFLEADPFENSLRNTNICMPIGGGAPSVAPFNNAGGAFCFDSNNNKLYIYNGTAWKSVTLS